MTRIQELLARNIKHARTRLGLSQMRLAELCGVSTSFIGEIETGRKYPSAVTLQKLCDALGLEPYQILYDEERWEVFDKFESITRLYRDLRERLNRDLEEIIRDHLR